jgi:hypothetical protein
MEKLRNAFKTSLGKSLRRRISGDLDAEWRIVLKRILRKYGMREWTEYIYLGIRSTGGELGTLQCIFGFHKTLLSDYQVFKIVPAPWS